MLGLDGALFISLADDGKDDPGNCTLDPFHPDQPLPAVIHSIDLGAILVREVLVGARDAAQVGAAVAAAQDAGEGVAAHLAVLDLDGVVAQECPYFLNPVEQFLADQGGMLPIVDLQRGFARAVFAAIVKAHIGDFAHVGETLQDATHHILGEGALTIVIFVAFLAQVCLDATGEGDGVAGDLPGDLCHGGIAGGIPLEDQPDADALDGVGDHPLAV